MVKENRKLISIVVPVYCEEESIGPFFEALTDSLETHVFDFEIVFVNDGSTDASLTHLQNLADANENVKIVSLSKNFGSLPAITAGFQEANGDAVVCLSVDMQDPPKLIPKLVEKWQEGFEVVWGIRRSRKDPLFKKIFAGLFYQLVRVIAFPNFPSGGFDLGLFDRRVIDIYCSLPHQNTSPFFLIYSLGFNQAQIPYDRAERLHGKSKWPFWKRMTVAIDIITGYSYAPIRLISLMGLTLFFVAIVSGIIIIYQKLVLDLGGAGWPSLAVMILFIGGIQILMLGVIAEYIWRISQRVSSQPHFIVKDVYQKQTDHADGE